MGMKKMDLFCMCLRSSSIKGEPHVIEGRLINKGDYLQIDEFRYSCIAGANGKCKYTSALFLHCSK